MPVVPPPMAPPMLLLFRRWVIVDLRFAEVAEPAEADRFRETAEASNLFAAPKLCRRECCDEDSSESSEGETNENGLTVPAG